MDLMGLVKGVAVIQENGKENVSRERITFTRYMAYE